MHHAPKMRGGIDEANVMAESAQVIGRAQPRRPRADDEDSLSSIGAWFRKGPSLFDGEVAEKTLNGVDPHRLVDLDAIARGLARMKADSTHDGGKGIPSTSLCHAAS